MVAINDIIRNIDFEDKFKIIIVPIAVILFALKYSKMMVSSSGACLYTNPKKKLLTIPLFVIFMLLLLFIILFTLGDFFYDEPIFTIEEKSIAFPVLILICAISVIIGSYYFITCSSHNSKNNLDISKFLNNDSIFYKLQSEYEKKMIGLQPISKCLSFHNGDYRNEYLDIENPEDITNTECVTPECKIISNCGSSIVDVCDPTKGAKLIDFYVAASNQSCHMPYTDEHYVSTEMLKTVLQAGARFINFNIYSETINGTLQPVVKSLYKNKLSENYLLLEDIWSTITQNAFLNKYSDPLIIHLDLKHDGVQDEIAKSLRTYINGQYFLNGEYKYNLSTNVLKEPICRLINKIILCVTGHFEDTLLEELVNINGNGDNDNENDSNARILYRSDPLISTFDPDADNSNLIHSNQNIYTIVIPDESDSDSENTIQKMNDAYNYGCNVYTMNYFNYFNDNGKMEMYCQEFEKSSFKMKCLDRQEKE